MLLIEFKGSAESAGPVHVNRDVVAYLKDGTPGKTTMIYFDKGLYLTVDGALSEVAEKLRVGH